MPFRIILCIFAAYCVFFGGTSTFRDGAHFYPPLFQYQLSEIFAGRFPWWNPYENIGQPQAANPTSMLFYPVFYLAAVPSIFAWFTGVVPFQIADPYYITCGYASFLWFHLFLSLWTSYRLARMWGCSQNAATLAAVCYTLSGSVLFQWNNAIFLVSAAWFPETIRTIVKIINTGKITDKTTAASRRAAGIKYTVRYAVLLSLIITGGDPQTAYNSVMCAVVFFVFRYYSEIKNLSVSIITVSRRITAASRRTAVKNLPAPCGSGLLFTFMLFLFSGILTFLLSAIQILPAWDFGKNSDRIFFSSNNELIYRFLILPWRIPELFLPNISGCWFPINTGWIRAFPISGFWSPSLYAGTLPFLFAVFGIIVILNNICKPKDCGKISACPLQNWAVIPALVLLALFILASLGNWFFIYPVMRYLPLYDNFRYPGKLMTTVMPFFIIFAAAGFDWVFCDDTEKRKKRISILMKWYLRTMLLMVLTIFCIMISHLIVGSDGLFGPFKNIFMCIQFLQVLFWCWLCYFIVRRILKKEILKSGTLLRPVALLIIIAFDLFIHNEWFFLNAPVAAKASIVPQNTVIYDTITAGNERDRSAAPIRIFRFPLWYPKQFEETTSPNRIQEIALYEFTTLQPKYNLPLHLNIVDVPGTLMPKEYAVFIDTLKNNFDNKELLSETFFNILGVEYYIGPAKVSGLQADLLPLPENAPPDVKVWKARNSRKRSFTLYEPNRIEYEAELDEPETVTVTEQYWKGWRAYDYGIEIPVKCIEKLFRGVDLPAGKHHIVMIYEQPHWKIGAVLSCIGLLLAAGGALLNQRFINRR